MAHRDRNSWRRGQVAFPDWLLPDSPAKAMKLLYGSVKGRLGFGKK